VGTRPLVNDGGRASRKFRWMLEGHAHTTAYADVGVTGKIVWPGAVERLDHIDGRLYVTSVQPTCFRKFQTVPTFIAVLDAREIPHGYQA